MTNFDKFKKQIKDSPLSNELYNLLNDIWTNEHFVFGVIDDAKTDKQKEELIDYIKNVSKNPKQITLKAWSYSNIRGIPDDEFDANPEDVIVVNLDE